jgi:dolichol-phosphate mannosyltransferase
MNASAAPVDVSIVSAVYGCQDCLRTLIFQIEQSLQGFGEFEIILVCDRSPDDSWEVIRDLSSENPRVKGILLARNYGQQVAISAGLAAANGNVAVVLDCDLQDDPAEIPRMLDELKSGAEIVIAVSPYRGSRSLIRRVPRKIYFKVLDYLAPETKNTNVSYFGLSRKAVNAFNRHTERGRHVSEIVRNLGLNPKFVKVEHRESSRSSSYSFSKRLALAYEGFLFNSERLSRHLTLGSIIVGLFSLLCGVSLVGWRIFRTDFPPGWVSQMILLALVVALQMFTFGFLGGLMQKILTEARARPLYLIDEELGIQRP